MRNRDVGSAIGLLAALTGCTHIVTQNTAYYENGPDQPEAPQGDLPAGTKAWVIWQKPSYVRLWTETGVDAWVWDKAVMTIWDFDQQQAEQKRQAEAQEKLRKAQRAKEMEPPPKAPPEE